MRLNRRVSGAACAIVMACAGAAHAGPPAICVPFECADETAIPMGEGTYETARGFSQQRAINTAFETLYASKDVLTHMETIRRLAIYLRGSEPAAQRVIAQLLERAAEAEADDEPDVDRGMAWFDAGYFSGALSHAGVDLGWKAGSSQGVRGLAWLERAAEAREGDPAVHFAAAILAHPAMRQSKRDLYEQHMRAALEGAAPGSLLRRNIEAHLAHWDESAAELLASR
ncbi:MAG: hypothetical protein H6811_05930 [Phycisphaeraceae bacterium]|nr:hypothetical protein [Phycisphaeraceae bacterium]